MLGDTHELPMPGRPSSARVSKVSLEQVPNYFCCANLRPSPLTAFAKSLALALDGFDLNCP